MQPGQNMLTPQSVQMLHPAKSHDLNVCPKTKQSLSVIEYAAAGGEEILFFFLRRCGIFSPQSVCIVHLASIDGHGLLWHTVTRPLACPGSKKA
jgi:hypothetical protein